MEPSWYKFQEDIKSIFLELGCDAQSNIRLEGVRTVHDIDVLVRSKYLGQPIQWIIEAKHWNKKVSKLHVLALRTIIDETGTDKGFIVSQKGFQRGALESASTTNITLLTFDELVELTQNVFHKDILRTYVRRLNFIANRYHSHSKSIRIDYGLRHDAWEGNVYFNVYFILMAASSVIRKALDNEYPIDLETHQKEKFGGQISNNFYQTINWLNLNLITAEERILDAEVNMQKNGDYKPRLKNVGVDESFYIKTLEAIVRGSLSE